MLIRGASASAAHPEGSVLVPVEAPSGAGTAAAGGAPSKTSSSSLSDKVAQMSLEQSSPPSARRAEAEMRWFDPMADHGKDEWTDDEALGYEQVECSEEDLMRSLAAAPPPPGPAAPKGATRDAIFEMYENAALPNHGDDADDEGDEGDEGSASDDDDDDDDLDTDVAADPARKDGAKQAEAAVSNASGGSGSTAGSCEAEAGVLTASNGAKADGPAKATSETAPVAATPSSSAAAAEAEATKARLRALHEQVMAMEATVNANSAAPPAQVTVSLAAAPVPVPVGTPAKSAAGESASASAAAAVAPSPSAHHGPSPSVLPTHAAILADDDAAKADGVAGSAAASTEEEAKARVRALHEQVLAMEATIAASPQPPAAPTPPSPVPAGPGSGSLVSPPAKNANTAAATTDEASNTSSPAAVAATAAELLAKDKKAMQASVDPPNPYALPSSFDVCDSESDGLPMDSAEEGDVLDDAFEPTQELDDGDDDGEEGEEGEEEEGEEEEVILESDPDIDPYVRATNEANKYATMSLKVVHERGRTGFEEHKDFPIRLHSLIAARYQVKEFLGSAAFSKAVQCLDLHTGEMVCVKIIKNNKDFFDQSLDEVMLLDYLKQHDPHDSHHVVHIYDFFYHKEHLFIVCELLRDNLYEFSRYNRETGDEPYFTLPRLRRIAKQCLEALAFVHKLKLIHCDLKPENILIKSYSRCEVKVIDFGSSCYTTDHLSSYVQSRSYRAPEVILGLPYDGKIDIWSLGAILAELLTGYVLFQNDSVAAMLARISAIVGPFPETILARGRHSHKVRPAPPPKPHTCRTGPPRGRLATTVPPPRMGRPNLTMLLPPLFAFSPVLCRWCRVRARPQRAALLPQTDTHEPAGTAPHQ